MKIDGFDIIAKQQLNEGDLALIRGLESVCNEQEHLNLKLNWGMLTDRKADETNDFFCYAKDGTLVGYLALYSFGRPQGEISGMVLPAFRRYRLFGALLNRAMEECRMRHIENLLFICERSSESGLAFIRSIGAAYDHSEYKMELTENTLPVSTDGTIVLRKATSSDHGMMAKLDAICFGIPEDDTVDFYSAENLSSSAESFIAVMGKQDIGKIRLEKEKDDIMIYGFAIQPEYRGKGYGRTTLRLAVNAALEKKPAHIALEVDCINDTALSLYQSCGFQTISIYDYFRLSVRGV